MVREVEELQSCKLFRKFFYYFIVNRFIPSGLFFFFGGMLQILGSVLEWVLGNTFPFIVFACYGKTKLGYANGVPKFVSINVY